MSLIPYHPREGREVVLRHRNAIVVRDPSSHRLEIRGLQQLTECPTCHQPLRRSSSPERSPFNHDPDSEHPYVDPNYFRMLRDDPNARSHSREVAQHTGRRHPPNHREPMRPPPSPVSRQLTLNDAPDHSYSMSDDGDGDGDDDGDDGDNGYGYDYGYGDESNGHNSGLGQIRGRQPDEDGSVGLRDAEHVRDAEFVSSTPALPPHEQGSRIRREAFSPNYFRSFFVVERELGRGGKGVVLLVRHQIDGCQLGHFACKRVPVGDDHAWLEKVLVEVELLAKLSHPNLVSYRHVWLEDVQLNRFGPSVACAFILQQYCNSGDLQHYILGDLMRRSEEPETKEDMKARMRRRSKGEQERPQGLGRRQLPFEDIYSLFKDIVSGLAYLHTANYIHRDLKPSNCLLHREAGGGGVSGKTDQASNGGSTERGRLVCLISDFGEVQRSDSMRLSTGSTGTISYCAPEVLRRDIMTGQYGNFTTKSDIFSLGMILYFMCFGRLPYRSANTLHEELEDMDALRAEIIDWKGLFQDGRRERPDLPGRLYLLLTKMTALSPNERPTAKEVLVAMKSESGLEGIMRGGHSGGPMGGATSTSVGLGINRRIQNLDSPVPSSSPAPDHPNRTRHATVVSVADEEVFDPPTSVPPQNGFANYGSQSPSALRHHRGSSFPSLAPSMREYSRSLTRSPDRRNRRGITPPGNGNEEARPHHLHNPKPQTLGSPGNFASRSPRISPSATQPPHSSPSPPHQLTPPPEPNLPLLMPPPTTRLAAIMNRASTMRYHAERWLFRNAHDDGHHLFPNVSAPETSQLVRLALFAVKVASLSWCCWPYSFGRAAGASLVALAALDLALAKDGPGTGLRRGPGSRGYEYSYVGEDSDRADLADDSDSRNVERARRRQSETMMARATDEARGDGNSRYGDVVPGSAAGTTGMEIVRISPARDDNERPGDAMFPDEDGAGRAHYQQEQEAGRVSGRDGRCHPLLTLQWLCRGWRRTVLLLAVHFAVLLVVARMDWLCAGPVRYREPWDDM